MAYNTVYDDANKQVAVYDEDGKLVPAEDLGWLENPRPFTVDEDPAVDVTPDYMTVFSALEESLRLINRRLDDLEARFTNNDVPPVGSTPTTGTPKPIENYDFTGVWYPGKTIESLGRYWVNTTSVPLTSPPSAFPGGPERWSHLFQEVSKPVAEAPETPVESQEDGSATDGSGAPSEGPTEPVETTPEPSIPAWTPFDNYKVGDEVTNVGFVWSCLIEHGAERQGTWAPTINTMDTVWKRVRPAV